MAQKNDGQGDLRLVPAQPEARKRIWLEAVALMNRQPRQRPMTRAELLAAASTVLHAAESGPDHLGYAMVMLNNAFWHEQFVGVPMTRRLLLLPRCLADLGGTLARAQALGYKVHVADGGPVVLRLLAEEEMDAVVGVGCLDSLEKAFQKVQQVGVPAIAVPLNCAGCKETRTDLDLLTFFLEGQGPAAAARTRSYLPLLRSAYRLFGADEFSGLLDGCSDRRESGTVIALDWLQHGGKRLRPFATLASYAAFAPGVEPAAAVKRVALAMEAFHKASLAHDDIEDDDALRYGQPTLHRKHGVPLAINVGDYLVGLGYRLALQGAQEFGAAAGCRLLKALSSAHVALAQGQGEELSWQREAADEVVLSTVLRRYMLKSSPAFEVSLLSGMILAGAEASHEKTVHLFCKHLGAAFQVQNDLSGWKSDALSGRPTALLALALERCGLAERATLLKPQGLEAIQEIYTRCAVFPRARQLVDRLRQHALELLDRSAEDGGNAALHDLLCFVLETVLEGGAGVQEPADAARLSA